MPSSRRARTAIRTPVVPLALALALALPGQVVAETDTTPPSDGRVVIANGATYVGPYAYVTATATDAQSGVGKVELSNDGKSWTAFQSGSQWRMAYDGQGYAIEGTQTVYARFTDGAGNVSEPVADTAIVDRTGPTATVRELSWNQETRELRLALTASDPAGLGKLVIHCRNTYGRELPFASEITLILDTTLSPTCTGYGSYTIAISVQDSLGNGTTKFEGVTVFPDIRIETPLPAVTGKPFIIRPVYPSDFVLPTDAKCVTEFRWGSDRALFNQESDNTFGGIIFEGTAADGYCGEWTFTLPWVPYRQYDWRMSGPFPGGLKKTFTATVGTTSPHLGPSNLPLVYVLMSSANAVVGEPLTWTLYRLGGAGAGAQGRWVAHLVGSGATTGTEVAFHQTGGTSFTIRPTRAGYWNGGWDPGPGYGRVLGGYYDPPVRAATVAATPAATPAAPPATEPATEPPAAPSIEPPSTDEPGPFDVAWLASIAPGPTSAGQLPATPAPSAELPAAAASTPAAADGVPWLLVAIGLGALAVLARPSGRAGLRGRLRRRP